MRTITASAVGAAGMAVAAQGGYGHRRLLATGAASRTDLDARGR